MEIDDPLAPLLDLPGVAAAFEAARAAVDGAAGRGRWTPMEAALRSAVASAALEGHGYDPEAVRAGAVDDPVVHGALRVAGGLGACAAAWRSAPLQALARLHLLAARGVVDEPRLGRPAAGTVVGAVTGDRLAGLAALVTGGGRVPALLLASVVHGELLTLRAFEGPNGVVARAAARLCLIATGFDPDGTVPVEVGHLARRPEYVGAAGAYATGTPDGVRSWLKHCAAAVEEAVAAAGG